jgi:hypothetical protein
MIHGTWEIKLEEEWKTLQSFRFMCPSENPYADCQPLCDGIPDDGHIFYHIYHTDHVTFSHPKLCEYDAYIRKREEQIIAVQKEDAVQWSEDGDRNIYVSGKRLIGAKA